MAGRHFLYQPAIEERLNDQIRLERAKKTLGCLKRKYRQIITYRYLENMSINEISERTGKSPNYVSVLIYQGTNRLKKYLDSRARCPA
jgi:RNA polymerase sigma factor (sigma-70 family)